MVGHVKVVIGVIVLKDTAGGEREEESAPTRSDSIDFSGLMTTQDVQLIDPVRSHEVRQWRRGWRRLRGRVVVMNSALCQRHNVLEGDVCLRGVVHTVRDGHHSTRGDGAAGGSVTAAHQRT